MDITYLHRCNLHYPQKTILISIIATLQNTFAIHSTLLDNDDDDDDNYYSFQDQWQIISDATFSVLVNKSNSYFLFEVYA